MAPFSSSKRNIRLPRCPHREEGENQTFVKYPLDHSPLTWHSCNDAYSFTWEADLADELAAVGPIDILKLSRSMGFCPQNRCQLGDVGNSPSPGQCPQNLCYTKVEDGRLSFGACCFNADGTFSSGDIIGYYAKSQTEPKPIYAHSRVALQSRRAQGFPHDFINANTVHPSLILAQCPIPALPPLDTADNHTLFQPTIEDNLIMIIEQNISHFVQLAPTYSGEGPPRPASARREYSKGDLCRAFPFDFIDYSTGRVTHPGISDFSYSLSEDGLYYTVLFRVTAEVSVDPLDGGVAVRRWVTPSASPDSDEGGNSSSDIKNCDNNSTNNGVADDCIGDTTDGSQRRGERRAVDVEYIWFLNWTDFEPPPPSAFTAIDYLTNRTVEHMKAGNNVAVACLSGRGRSGTYGSIVVGKLLKIDCLSSLVDVIVGMREHRDGLLELPSQLRYVAGMLRLPDPSLCDWMCQAYKYMMPEQYALMHTIFSWNGEKAFDWNPSPLLPQTGRAGEKVGSTLIVAAVLCYALLSKRRYLMPVSLLGLVVYCSYPWFYSL